MTALLGICVGMGLGFAAGLTFSSLSWFFGVLGVCTAAGWVVGSLIDDPEMVWILKLDSASLVAECWLPRGLLRRVTVPRGASVERDEARRAHLRWDGGALELVGVVWTDEDARWLESAPNNKPSTPVTVQTAPLWARLWIRLHPAGSRGLLVMPVRVWNTLGALALVGLVLQRGPDAQTLSALGAHVGFWILVGQFTALLTPTEDYQINLASAVGDLLHSSLVVAIAYTGTEPGPSPQNALLTIHLVQALFCIPNIIFAAFGFHIRFRLGA